MKLFDKLKEIVECDGGDCGPGGVVPAASGEITTANLGPKDIGTAKKFKRKKKKIQERKKPK